MTVQRRVSQDTIHPFTQLIPGKACVCVCVCAVNPNPASARCEHFVLFLLCASNKKARPSACTHNTPIFFSSFSQTHTYKNTHHIRPCRFGWCCRIYGTSTLGLKRQTQIGQVGGVLWAELLCYSNKKTKNTGYTLSWHKAPVTVPRPPKSQVHTFGLASDKYRQRCAKKTTNSELNSHFDKLWAAVRQQRRRRRFVRPQNATDAHKDKTPPSATCRRKIILARRQQWTPSSFPPVQKSTCLAKLAEWDTSPWVFLLSCSGAAQYGWCDNNGGAVTELRSLRLSRGLPRYFCTWCSCTTV